MTNISSEQLYSTASYQSGNLLGIGLAANDLRGWNFTNQNLAGTNLGGLIGPGYVQANLEGSDFSGANLRGAFMFGSIGLENAKFNGALYDDRTVFPDGFDPQLAGLTYSELASGDYNGDLEFGLDDLNLLLDRIREVMPASLQQHYGIRSRNAALEGRWFRDRFEFDLVEDGIVDEEDLRYWIHSLKQTWFGDANLDGEFNSSDLVAVFQAGEYEDNDMHNSTWDTGDWDGNGDFESSDLIVAFQDGGYHQGTRNASAVVPEPNGFGTMVITLAIISSTRRRAQRF